MILCRNKILHSYEGGNIYNWEIKLEISLYFFRDILRSFQQPLYYDK